MDRYNLNLKKLKEKGLSSKRIVILTDVALDDKIDDDEYELLYNSNISDKQLKEIYNIVKDIKTNEDKSIRDSNIINIINFLLSLETKCLDNLIYSEVFALSSIFILMKNYKTKYGINGINLINAINKSCYVLSPEYAYRNYGKTTSITLYLTDKEKESIYHTIVNNYSKYLGHKNFYDYFESLEILIYYLKAKIYTKSYYNKISDDQVQFMTKLIFESTNNKYADDDYIFVCKFLIDKLYDDNVSIDILSKYINTDKSIVELENCIKNDILQYVDIDTLLPVDKMIKLLKSIPASYLNSNSFKYIFDMREIDSKKLRILLNLDNLSSARIENFYCTVKGISANGFDSINYSKLADKINAIDLDSFETYFDSSFLDTDIDILDEYGNILYNIYKDNFGKEYYNFIFSHVKSLLPPKNNKRLHYIIIRFMKILINIAYHHKDDEDNSSIDIEEINSFIPLLTEIFDLDTLKNQRIDNKLDKDVFEDYLYEQYEELINLTISLYNFGIPVDKIKCIYNDINKDLLDCKIDYDSWDTGYPEVSKFDYKLKIITNTFDSYVLNNYSEDEREFIKKHLESSYLKESCKYFNKLYQQIDTNFFSLFEGRKYKLYELFINILLCTLSNVNKKQINNEVSRLLKKLTKKDSNKYDIYELMKEEKFYDFYKSKIEEVKE